MRRFLVTDRNPDLVSTTRDHTSIHEVTDIWLKGAGFFAEEEEDDGDGGKARPFAIEWSGPVEDADMGDSEDDVDRAADIQKTTVSMDEVLVSGYQRAQKEKGVADALSSKFRDEPVERLVGDGKPEAAAPKGAEAVSFGQPVRTRRYSKSPAGVRGLRTGEGEQGDAPFAVHRRARSVFKRRRARQSARSSEPVPLRSQLPPLTEATVRTDITHPVQFLEFPCATELAASNRKESRLAVGQPDVTAEFLDRCSRSDVPEESLLYKVMIKTRTGTARPEKSLIEQHRDVIRLKIISKAAYNKNMAGRSKSAPPPPSAAGSASSQDDPLPGATKVAMPARRAMPSAPQGPVLHPSVPAGGFRGTTKWRS